MDNLQEVGLVGSQGLDNMTYYKECESKCEILKVYADKKEAMRRDPHKTYLLFHGVGYAHKTYEVIHNGARLPFHKIAAWLDKGNLCYGWRADGRYIKIHTD